MLIFGYHLVQKGGYSPFKSLAMKYISLTIPDNKYPFFMELVKNLRFVKVQEASVDTEEEVLKGIEQGFREVKLIEEGKMTSRPAKDFLNEL